MVISWDELTADTIETGGSDITEYVLLWNDGDGNAPSIALPVGSSGLATTHPINSGITSGNRYKFTIQAINKVGESAVSSELEVRAAVVPDRMAAPTTAISDTNVTISWTELTHPA